MPLRDLQHWFQQAIRRPRGVGGVKDVASVILPSQRLSSHDRLAVYANAYFARLIDCLRDSFPVIRRWLGAELFDSFMLSYLQRYPSASYTLDQLGTRFEKYLRETRPAEVKEHWPDFLADLAAMEWAINEVFDGPGAEGVAPPTIQQPAAVDPRRFLDSRLRMNPSLRLMRFEFPVNAFFTQARQAAEGDELSPPQPAQSWLALSRRQYVVRRRDLNRGPYELLRRLMAGATVMEAIEQAADFMDTEGDDDRLLAAVRQWFTEWSAEGYFTAIDGAWM